MIETSSFREVLKDEIGKGWRTETDTRTLMVFSGGSENRFTVEIEYEDGVYTFLMEDSIMSANASHDEIDSDVALHEFRDFVSSFADSVTAR